MNKIFFNILILFLFMLQNSTVAMGQSHHNDEDHPMMGYDQQEHHHEQGEMAGQVSDQGVCHTTEDQKAWPHHYEHNGQMYHFCSQGAMNMFKSDPEKYKDKIKTFDVEAFQFGFEPDVIKVKKGDIVRVNVQSRDVPHGFNIKDYDINVRIEKDNPKTVEFIADKAGEFDIVCSVYCGRGHHSMKANLIVTE